MDFLALIDLLKSFPSDMQSELMVQSVRFEEMIDRSEMALGVMETE